MPKHVCKRALLHTLPHHGHLPITYISILRIFMSAGAASQAGGESSVEARKKNQKKKFGTRTLKVQLKASHTSSSTSSVIHVLIISHYW